MQGYLDSVKGKRMERVDYTPHWYLQGELTADAKYIRQAVFCEEQGYSEANEFDDIDYISYHLVFYFGKHPVATGRIYTGKDGETHLGRIAVVKEHRGTGLGQRVMKEMIRKAGEINSRSLHLSAQSRVVTFYEKLGFTIAGEEYMDGHVPHRDMYMIL